WQVAHQEAEEQTDAAVSARKKHEKARDDLLSASSDVTHLQAALADWQKKHDALAKSLAFTEQQREDASKLAAIRQQWLDKTKSDLGLSEKQLKRLQADLEELLASEKKS